MSDGSRPRGFGLRETFGDIDIYLFDQLLKGRIGPGARVLDAGCGGGRNLAYLARAGCRVCGVDGDAAALARARTRLGPEAALERATIEALPFPDGAFDAVLCNAVLHFARDETQWQAMVAELWRVLAPGGLFFSRLASDIGIEHRVRRLHGRWAELPDGTERFLVDEAMLLEATGRLGGRLLDPIKTTNVQNLRCMTTWVLEKPEDRP